MGQYGLFEKVAVFEKGREGVVHLNIPKRREEIRAERIRGKGGEKRIIGGPSIHPDSAVRKGKREKKKGKMAFREREKKKHRN